MKSKLLSLPVLVVAVLALALGSAGTATAGALTKGAVKKIAAKVVAKAAPKLSVSHAKTADTATNATQLGGQPGSAYQTPTYHLRLPSPATPTSTKDWNLTGVPAGTYVFSYDVVATMTAAGDLNCWVDPKDGTGVEQGNANGAAYGTASAAVGTGVLTVGATTPQLHCGGEGDTFVINSVSGNSYPSFITLTKVSSVTGGTLNNQ